MNHTALEALAAEARKGLQQRPSVSIRKRLGIGLVVWIMLSLGLAVTSLMMIRQIEDKLHVMESGASYLFEIQQARRFEKNFFLYQTNLADAFEHVHTARALLDAERDDLAAVVGTSRLAAMVEHLTIYEALLRQLGSESQPVGDLKAVEAELRQHGSTMVSTAEEVLARERSAVNSLLLVSRRLPLAFLVLLVLLVAYLIWFISRQMLAPLARMMEVTRHVAEGRLMVVKSRRRYRDEFSEMALAMNHMVCQLLQRQNLLVKAHKLKAVGTLTAGVAHELNNPINNIMLTAGTLEEDYGSCSDDERKEMIHDLVSESERARKIVRNLLDFARESEADIDALSVQEILEETLRLTANQIRLCKVQVKKNIANNLPALYGDRQQLQQVFLNMVLNALDAMPEGGILTISIESCKERHCVDIKFQDNGVGISSEHLTDIFDPFFSSKNKAKGTGLGLSVSEGIVKQHGGDIRVSSKVGEGTTFTVVLPVAKVPADLASPNR